MYARNCQAVPPSLSLLDEVGRPPEENSRRGADGREREMQRERERETSAFSLLVSAGYHSTSASIVFRESRRGRLNGSLNLARKTPARNRKMFHGSDREAKPLGTLSNHRHSSLVRPNIHAKLYAHKLQRVRDKMSLMNLFHQINTIS